MFWSIGCVSGLSQGRFSLSSIENLNRFLCAAGDEECDPAGVAQKGVNGVILNLHLS